jgi:hypothetical protein
MSRMMRLIVTGLLLSLTAAVSGALGAAAPAVRNNLPVRDDPLVRMPGTQPGQVTLQGSTECYACHGSGNGPWTRSTPDQRGRTNYEEYNIFKGWQGSTMGNSARDPLMFACFTVAAQDSYYALGNPNAVDICLRCHFPKGWLEGRSSQPGQLNASAMTGDDYDGVQCSFCHRMSDPFYKSTYSGAREGSNWSIYWDEQNSPAIPSQYRSQVRAYQTLLADMLISPTIRLFSGSPFYLNDNPFSTLYTENGAGQYFISPTEERRGSFADVFVNDPQPDHDTLYSRYHKGKFICETCHDVSNPVMANLPQKNAKPGDKVVLVTEKLPVFAFSHVERTFSEFRLSAYNAPGGADGKGNFKPYTGPRTVPAPAGWWETDQPGNKITKCQDCHMCSRWSIGSNDPLGPVRPEESLEHPNTWTPCHALTGGNVWIPSILASIAPDAPSNMQDPINLALLTGTAVDKLTMDVMQGSWTTLRPPTEPTRIYDALVLTATRNRGVLGNAANITDLKYLPTSGALTFRVQNNSGHKLISGFPEGRRMFVNIKVFKGTTLLQEINPYDITVGTLKGLPDSSSSPRLAANELYADPLVYEVKLGSTITGEQATFHFALATHRYKDNRIPPKGFNIAGAAARLSEPVWQGQSAPNYFTAAEYAGGYDEVALTVPKGATSVSVNLYYQTTSREYIEFLRDEINGTGRKTLPDSAYIVQTDSFFTKLRGWGDTIFNLWDNNKNLDGGKPYLMTKSVWSAP